MLGLMFVALILGIVWLLALSFFLWKMRTKYAVLTEGASQKTLPEILEKLTKDLDRTKQDVLELKRKYDTMDYKGKQHIQKVGLLRFNPFKDTGGDQSFILTLVDANNSGIIISGLYSRSGTRWYAKKIVDGKGIEYELSEEEQKALKLATSGK